MLKPSILNIVLSFIGYFELSISDAMWKIARLEGVHTLWNGTVPSLWLATNPAIQFMVYETIKRYFQRMLNAEVSEIL